MHIKRRKSRDQLSFTANYTQSFTLVPQTSHSSKLTPNQQKNKKKETKKINSA